MKRVASLSILVLLVVFPLVAQTSAQGSFNFKGTEGLQTIDFDAARRRTLRAGLLHAGRSDARLGRRA